MLLNTATSKVSAKSAVHLPRAQRSVSSFRPQCISAPAFSAVSLPVPSAPQRNVMAKGASGDKPTILVAEKLGQVGIDMLGEVGNVDCSYDMTPADLCAKISLCDAIVIRSGTKVTREVIEASKGRLKVVGRAGVGIDNVDLAAATENGVMVVNAPNANTVAAAEHGVALLCALSRNVAQADASMKKGGWERSKYVGVSLVGKTIAVMGFGKVGADVARRCKGLGMNVISHDPYAAEEKARALNVRLVTFQEAIQTADFISLHMPLTPGTKDLFNAEVRSGVTFSVHIVHEFLEPQQHPRRRRFQHRLLVPDSAPAAHHRHQAASTASLFSSLHSFVSSYRRQKCSAVLPGLDSPASTPQSSCFSAASTRARPTPCSPNWIPHILSCVPVSDHLYLHAHPFSPLQQFQHPSATAQPPVFCRSSRSARRASASSTLPVAVSSRSRTSSPPSRAARSRRPPWTSSARSPPRTTPL